MIAIFYTPELMFAELAIANLVALPFGSMVIAGQTWLAAGRESLVKPVLGSFQLLSVSSIQLNHIKLPQA